MSITYTFHDVRARDTVALVDVLAGQSAGTAGDAVTLAIGDTSAQIAVAGLYRLKCAVACRVRIGVVGADVTKGEPWSVGDTEIRYIASGQYIRVGAA